MAGSRFSFQPKRQIETFGSLALSIECLESLDRTIDEYHEFLAPGGRAVISDPARPYLQLFSDKMKALGFQQALSVRTVRDSEGVIPVSPTGFREVFVQEFTRSRPMAELASIV